jgi:transposase
LNLWLVGRAVSQHWPGVVLACAEGLDNKSVAKKLRCSLGMAGKWRSRFLTMRLEGLYDEPRPGAPRKVNDDQVEQIVIQTLESTPRGETHWSTRELAKATGLSRMTISRIWQAFGLQPHRTETFKLSLDPLLIEKVRDIVGLYMNPPDHAVVFCIDEKSQIQALDRTQPMLPLRPAPKRLQRSADHQPVSAKQLAVSLPVSAWREIRWRPGSRQTLRSRFAAIRVRPAHRDDKRTEPHPEEWLLIEWPKKESDPPNTGYLLCRHRPP